MELVQGEGSDEQRMDRSLEGRKGNEDEPELRDPWEASELKHSSASMRCSSLALLDLVSVSAIVGAERE